MTDLIGEAWYRLRPDTSTFRLEAQAGVQAALAGLGPVGGAGLARSALQFGGIGAALTGFTIAAREAIGGAASLEQQLDLLQEVGQATDAEMEQVSRRARELGADLTLPGISASDSAAAMLELIKGGVGIGDTLDGSRGALQLATAANIDFAESAQIVARTLTTFEEPGSSATRIADLLAAAADAATGEITDMALALQQSGAVARQAGLSVDQTVTAIALLAKNGLLGSDAGTSLRTTLLRLIPQSEEARQVMAALGVETADAAGNIRPLRDIFDDYRVALAKLTPELQQAALTQIFGTDAIRAAAIFAREGAAGFDEMADATGRQGAAADTAAARTKGLTGEAGGLASNMETLATNIGGLAVPALTDLTSGAGDAVGALNELFTLIEESGDVEIAVGFTVGDVGDAAGEAIRSAVRGPIEAAQQIVTDTPLVFGVTLGDVSGVVNRLRGLREEAQATVEEMQESFSAVGALTEGGGLLPEGLFAKDRIEARQAGEQLGRDLGEAIPEGIISAEQEAVNAARKTLAAVIREGREAVAETIREGREAVQEAIRQGNEAVRLSAIDARSNLVSLGQTLAGDALRLLEEGPLARRIDALRLQLDRTRSRGERTGLREEIRDAERALREAETQSETAGPLTRAQTAARERFLEPFRREVRDAKAALAEFNTETVIGQLEAQAEAQKRVVQQGIADLIVQFNSGAINVAQANTRLANLLASNGIAPYRAAGDRLGVAFVAGVEVHLNALREQMIEIARGLDVPEIGIEPTVVSPATVQRRAGETVAEARARAAQATTDARERAQAQTAAAQDNLRRSNNALRRATDDSADAAKDLAAAIRAAFKTTPAKRSRPSIPEGTSVNR